jgi:hypothetical protein
MAKADCFAKLPRLQLAMTGEKITITGQHGNLISGRVGDLHKLK